MRPDEPDVAEASTHHSGGDGGRWRRALTVAALAALAGITTAAVVPPSDTDLAPVGFDLGERAEAALDARPAPTTTTTTTAPPPTLPVPEALPTGYEAGSNTVLGSLEIPRLGLRAPLLQGMALSTINYGPSHWPGTALPGQLGNVVVAGHRTTYSKPFADLDRLVAGDLVHFHLDEGGTHTYEVRGVIIVPEAAIGIAAQHWAHTATLFACHPKGRATHRIVAKLRLLDAEGEPVDEESALPPLDVGLRPEDHSLTVRDDGAPLDPGQRLAGAEG